MVFMLLCRGGDVLVYMCTSSKKKKKKKILHHPSAPVRSINPTLPADVIADLDRAVRDARAFHASVRAVHVTSHQHGADGVKALGAPPDSFMQIAYQMAYARAAAAAGLPAMGASVYESCNMRGYLRGRTEAIRPVSCETQAFVALDAGAKDAVVGTELSFGMECLILVDGFC
jgi:hypothetical protein